MLSSNSLDGKEEEVMAEIGEASAEDDDDDEVEEEDEDEEEDAVTAASVIDAV